MINVISNTYPSSSSQLKQRIQSNQATLAALSDYSETISNSVGSMTDEWIEEESEKILKKIGKRNKLVEMIKHMNLENEIQGFSFEELFNFLVWKTHSFVTETELFNMVTHLGQSYYGK